MKLMLTFLELNNVISFFQFKETYSAFVFKLKAFAFCHLIRYFSRDFKTSFQILFQTLLLLNFLFFLLHIVSPSITICSLAICSLSLIQGPFWSNRPLTSLLAIKPARIRIRSGNRKGRVVSSSRFSLVQGPLWSSRPLNPLLVILPSRVRVLRRSKSRNLSPFCIYQTVVTSLVLFNPTLWPRNNISTDSTRYAMMVLFNLRPLDALSFLIYLKLFLL